MKMQGTFTFDSETGELRLNGDDCAKLDPCFSLLIQAQTEKQLGTWQATPTVPKVRLTFDKDGADFVCSDITTQ